MTETDKRPSRTGPDAPFWSREPVSVQAEAVRQIVTRWDAASRMDLAMSIMDSVTDAAAAIVTLHRQQDVVVSAVKLVGDEKDAKRALDRGWHTMFGTQEDAIQRGDPEPDDEEEAHG